MNTKLGRVVILVKDYDEAFEFYEKNLGCKKFFDLTDDRGLRYLHVGFNSESSAGIWFLKAITDEEKERVGNQTSGQPVFVLYTDSFDDHLETLINNEVKIVREPEITEEYMLLNFLDLYGNVITLVQLINN
ncbi:MAG TPA: VOC family protein [Ignavibacteria bacterium]|nr:VOC family protein [Ignavibacteria bacterium]HMR39739.1 VOC family protein [Ignavibacteria bacterium]